LGVYGIAGAGVIELKLQQGVGRQTVASTSLRNPGGRMLAQKSPGITHVLFLATLAQCSIN
jgi:hypothetical protein